MNLSARKYQLGCFFTLTLLSFLVYFNMLAGSFHFDDQSLVSRWWIADIDFFRKYVDLDVGNRPILLLTYAINNSLNPTQVFGFHLVNLQLHVCVAILIFLILRRMRHFLKPGNPGLPLIAAALFAVHPLNTDSISYISSRSSALATFFYLLTLYAFLSIFIPGRSKIAKAGLGCFCFFGFYMAIASKLIAATLPLALALWFWFVVNNRLALRLPLLRIRGVLIGTAVVFLAVLGYLISAGWLLPRDQGVQLFGRGSYFLLQCKVIVFYYIEKFLFPINLNVDVGYPFSAFWSDAQIPLAVALIVGVIFCLWKWNNVYLRIAAAWFFLTLSPTSSIIPLNDLAVEHHTYLPMTLGLCLGAGWAVAQLNPPRRLAFLAALLIGMATLGTARNAVWLNDLVLWADSAEKNPFSPRTQNNLGKAWYDKSASYLQHGETARAREALELSLVYFKKSVANLAHMGERFYNTAMLDKSLDQLASSDLQKEIRRGSSTESVKRDLEFKGFKLLADFADPHYNIASVYLDLGRFAEAEQEYLAVIGLDPDFFSAYLGLGSVYNQTGRYAEALARYKEGLDRKLAAGLADDPLLHLNLGEVYGKMGNYQAALTELKQAIQLSPGLDKAHYNMGIVYTLLEDYDNAEQSYLACLGNNGNFSQAQFNLAALYQLKKEWKRSTQEFQKYMTLMGPDVRAHLQIARNHQHLEQWAEARESYLQVLKLDPRHEQALASLDQLARLEHEKKPQTTNSLD